MTKSKNLWGAIPTLPERLPNSPRLLLEAQGDFLTQATNGKLVGEVSPGLPKEQLFSATLKIRVPSLNDYVFGILSIEYPIHLYPLKVILYSKDTQMSSMCKDVEEYEERLEEILKSAEVQSVVSALLSHVEENNL